MHILIACLFLIICQVFFSEDVCVSEVSKTLFVPKSPTKCAMDFVGLDVFMLSIIYSAYRIWNFPRMMSSVYPMASPIIPMASPIFIICFCVDKPVE